MYSPANWIENLETALGGFILKYRLLIIAVFCVFTVLAGLGLGKIKTDPSYRIYFEEDNVQLAEYDRMEEEYSDSDGLLLMIDFGSENRLFTPENLRLIQELTETAWQTPYVARVDSLTNHQHISADGDHLIISDLVSNPDELDQEAIAEIRTVALSEPSVQRMLVDSKGRVAGIMLSIDFPTQYEQRHMQEIMGFLDEIQQNIESRHPKLAVYITGRPAVDYGMNYQINRDISSTIPIAGVLIIFTMLLLCRSIWGTFSTALIIILSLVTATGMAGYLGLTLGGANIFAPIIIITVAAASCVHIVMTFLDLHRSGQSTHSAIRESIRINAQPVALTGVTTALGFLSILQSNVPVFRTLGAIAAMGIIYSTLLALFFLPALLSFLRDPTQKAKDIKSNDLDITADTLGVKLTEGLGRCVVNNRWPILFITSIFIVVSVSGIPQNHLIEHLNEFLHEDIKERKAIDFGSEHLLTATSLQFELSAQDPDGVFNPLYLQEADKFVEWLHSQPEVLHVLGITDIMKRLNKNMHGGGDAWSQVPDSAQLAAQYFLLYELSMPYGLDVTNIVNLDRSASRVVVNISKMDTVSIRAFVKRSNEWLENNVRYIDPSPARGLFAIMAELAIENARIMLTITALALVGISLFLILMLGDLRLGLISLIPNLVPAAIGFGIWGFMSGEISMPMSLVATMTMGIIVDDTVHFLSKYNRARKEHGMAVDDAIVYSFKTVGQALIVTSLMLIIGFVTIMFSVFAPNVQLATLTSMIIAFALLADFFFLPPILLMLDKNKKKTANAA